MEKIFCTMIKKEYELKEGTQNSWILINEVKEEITQKFYNNVVEAAPFFRRLGGSEYHEKTYTKRGNIVTKIISKNPDRTIKNVREFINFR